MSIQDYESLSHSVWDCKYHIVFIPKYRRKVRLGIFKLELGKIFHELAGHKKCHIIEGHLMPDLVFILFSIHQNLKFVIMLGYIKGKSAHSIARTYSG